MLVLILFSYLILGLVVLSGEEYGDFVTKPTKKIVN
jgi:hypothetical protein